MASTVGHFVRKWRNVSLAGLASEVEQKLPENEKTRFRGTMAATKEFLQEFQALSTEALLEVQKLGRTWEPPRPEVDIYFREPFRDALHMLRGLGSVTAHLQFKHVRDMGYQKLHWVGVGLLNDPARAK